MMPSLQHGRKAYGSKYFLKSLHWLNLSLSWQLDKEKSWKPYISSEPGTYKCAFQVKSATCMHWFLKQSVLSRTWYALDLLLVKAVKSKFYTLLWWQSVVTVIGLLETNAASLILIFFCIQFSFSFLYRNNSLLYDTDIQKECLIYVNILQKKVLSIYNFVNMFLSHKVRIVLLDNHFSFVKVIWNVKSNPLQLKMKISIGLNFLWASFLLVSLGLTFSNVSASNICRG